MLQYGFLSSVCLRVNRVLWWVVASTFSLRPVSSAPTERVFFSHRPRFLCPPPAQADVKIDAADENDPVSNSAPGGERRFRCEARHRSVAAGGSAATASTVAAPPPPSDPVLFAFELEVHCASEWAGAAAAQAAVQVCAMRVWRTLFFSARRDSLSLTIPAVSRPSRASFFRYADSKLLPISTLVAVHSDIAETGNTQSGEGE